MCVVQCPCPDELRNSLKVIPAARRKELAQLAKKSLPILEDLECVHATDLVRRWSRAEQWVGTFSETGYEVVDEEGNDMDEVEMRNAAKMIEIELETQNNLVGCVL